MSSYIRYFYLVNSVGTENDESEFGPTVSNSTSMGNLGCSVLLIKHLAFKVLTYLHACLQALGCLIITACQLNTADLYANLPTFGGILPLFRHIPTNPTEIHEIPLLLTVANDMFNELYIKW